MVGGVALVLSMPVVVVELLALVVILVGAVVVSRGFVTELRNP